MSPKNKYVYICVEYISNKEIKKNEDTDDEVYEEIMLLLKLRTWSLGFRLREGRC